MGEQAKGWNCGGSNGEALSRLLAEELSGGPFGQLAAFASGPAWDHAGRPNWIDTTENTDQNYVSTGCGMVYLYWMKVVMGYSIPEIVNAAGNTLAENYQALTGSASAWADFHSACEKFKVISSDNPWSPA
jgi:hypothetical protein